jgi:hypothetical protein
MGCWVKVLGELADNDEERAILPAFQLCYKQ